MCYTIKALIIATLIRASLIFAALTFAISFDGQNSPTFVSQKLFKVSIRQKLAL